MFIAALLLGITVTLPAQTRVRGTEITLGAIATVSGDEVASAEDLAALPLGYAPAPGFARVLDRASIARQIQARFGAVQVEFVGSPSTRIVPLTELVAASRLVEVARNALAGELNGIDADVKLQGSPVAIDVPVGVQPYELSAALPRGSVRPGVVSVPIQILVDGQPYRTVRTTWEVEYWVEVPVLLRDVGLGETLTADALEMQRVRLGRALRGDPLKPAMALGNVAARALRTGDVLMARDVRRPHLIQRGDTVYLEVKKGGITARIAAVAQGNGARGDRIQVVVASSQKEMSGTVQSRDTVTIELGSSR